MAITKLTQALIDNLPAVPDSKRRLELVDGHSPQAERGLYLEVRSNGSATFFLRKRDQDGRTRHYKLGGPDELTLTQARAKASKLKGQIAMGEDPRAEARTKKSVLTFSTFFEDHYLPHAKQRKRTWAKDDEIFRYRIKSRFGDKRLNQITRQEIQAFHTNLKNEGLAGASCDHYIKLIRRCLNLAVEWGMLEKNVAAGISMYREANEVEHYLGNEELERLLNVLRTDSNRPVCSILLFLVSTGVRLNEALTAEWRQVDRANRVFRIEAHVAKGKRVRSVPLNDSALEVLDQLDTEDKFDHLFINRKTGEPYTTIHKVWDRLRNEADLPHLRIHDLRHQYASFLVNSGRTLYEVQQILGHSNPTVTQRYAHLSTKALQEAADTASAIIQGAGGGTET